MSWCCCPSSAAHTSPPSRCRRARWFAEYQPFTPVSETVRGLLLGAPIGNDAFLAIAWCTVIAVTG